MPLILLAFIVVPLAELWLIFQVGDLIGVWWTLGLLLGAGLLGSWLVKREGRRVWAAFRTALEERRWPGDEVTQGALVLIGGTLLVTPGFLTDVVGLLAVAPPTRTLIAALIRRRLARRIPPGARGVAARVLDHRDEAPRRPSSGGPGAPNT